MLQAQLTQPPIHTSSPLLSLPYEVLLDILQTVATATSSLCPEDLLNLSGTCRHLYSIIQTQSSIWKLAFSTKYDTGAIYRRQLHTDYNWQANVKRRYRALSHCAYGVQACTSTGKVAWLNHVDWQCLWDMISEHDDMNITHILNHEVHKAAIASFRLGRFHDRDTYPVCLPILSVLVNYDFTLTRFLTSEQPSQLVSPELSQFAYDFEADALIPGPSYSLSETDPAEMDRLKLASSRFYPAQDALTSALHLFFVTIFAQHPDPYDAIPGCIPIPLFQLSSNMFDVEFLRRYERELFQASLDESRSGWEQRHQQQRERSAPAITNRYESSGFASKERYISDAYLVEGEWMGYYSFLDPDDSLASDRSNGRREDWFDGPMRLTLRRVPLDDEAPDSDQATYSMATSDFPSQHLRSSPLTRFEGHGSDNLGAFTITGLVDDTECGQMTWEKTYVDSAETWEYSGRFILPMGLCGRWGDEEYGGPWWMWRVEDGTSQADVVQPLVAGGGIAGAAAAVAKATAEAKL
ncbi:hypothetical protein INT43_007024 [Umbelopsis isabellina]|uniref:F-box domain-containing protein n=1 Tax=Mortierella isabellina TaxID=91625 RepID=A0A8H7PXC1_MORIS|nr:hypothetical protein INT43_007024 [Umbelopsis isabellina]